MLPNTALYAAKKRKKPVQKIPKPPPPDGAKSNPSKRHRDRLNSELDKLTSLLPFTEEVRARLDKLSVLRLSVGYLKVKSFFNATLKASQSGSSWTSERSLMFGGNVPNALTPSSSSSSSSSAPSISNSVVASIDGVTFSEGDLLLQALNGFVLVVTAEGYVFYTSPTIQDFLGFHQSDVVHQSVFELIHTDDRALFRRQLHFSLNPNSDSTASPTAQNSVELSNVTNYDPLDIPPENSSFLERNFCCRFRCLLDNSSGFLALNFHGRLKLLHGQNRVSEDGTLVPPQLALFAVATPLQPPSILEIRTKTLIFQSKHKLDFSPMGIDSRGKIVLGYSEVEICSKGSGYNFIHAADMMFCADNHLRMMKTGDSGFNVFRLLTKSGTWVWVQAHARVVFKAGKPDFIVSRQRPLTNEEGEEQLRLRRLQLPFGFTTGEAVLYDTIPTVEVPEPCSAPKQRKLDSYTVSKDSLLGCMLSQDQSLYCEHNASTITSLNDVAFQDTHATVSVPGETAPKPEATALVKNEATVQDMMETLQQILGDGDLTESLEVEPDELKSWESTLLKMNFGGGEFADDLNDIISNDILSYVEEQLQKEGGLKLLDQLDDVPGCLPALDLQNQDLDRGGQQSFSWSLEPQGQPTPNGGPMMAPQPPPPGAGTVKLSHMDFPVLKGPSLHQLSAPLHSCSQTQSQLRQVGAGRPPFPIRHAPTAQPPLSRPVQTRLPLRTPPQPETDRQLNHMFGFPGGQWSPSVPNANPAVETYAPNISSQPSFPAGPGPSPGGLLQGRFALQTQNGDSQRPSWPPGQQQMGLGQMSEFQRNPVDFGSGGGGGGPAFRTAETTAAPFPVQQELEPSSSCMFRNATAPRPVNGLRLQARPNPAASQIPSKPSCFYQTAPAGGAVPGMTAVPHPDEAALSCQMAAGLNANGLLAPQQPYLSFNEQTQINGCPAVRNGGFPFSSLPNGNTCYSENK
uniref:Aryl hydrocarbon receptor n=1 Tax=Salarias fasciatus TaxID=181472 RepID=A0A672I1N4_SALFA